MFWKSANYLTYRKKGKRQQLPNVRGVGCYKLPIPPKGVYLQGTEPAGITTCLSQDGLLLQ